MLALRRQLSASTVACAERENRRRRGFDRERRGEAPAQRGLLWRFGFGSVRTSDRMRRCCGASVSEEIRERRKHTAQTQNQEERRTADIILVGKHTHQRRGEEGVTHAERRLVAF